MRYRYLYNRLIEVVGRQVGIIMEIMEDSGKDRNTMVIFTADPGEMNDRAAQEPGTLQRARKLFADYYRNLGLPTDPEYIWHDPAGTR